MKHQGLYSWHTIWYTSGFSSVRNQPSQCKKPNKWLTNSYFQIVTHFCEPISMCTLALVFFLFIFGQHLYTVETCCYSDISGSWNSPSKMDRFYNEAVKSFADMKHMLRCFLQKAHWQQPISCTTINKTIFLWHTQSYHFFFLTIRAKSAKIWLKFAPGSS